MKVRTRSKKVDKAWLHDHVSDPYVKLAQKEGYRSRAAYKLRQIDEQFALVKPGQLVVDLGAAPGAWSQYVTRRFGQGRAPATDQGAVVALDVLPMEPIEGVTFIRGDFRDEETAQSLQAALGGRAAHLVLSDMAPNLSGIASADAARMAHLAELAVEFARRNLEPDGALLVKAFHGSGYSQLVELFKRTFRSVRAIKPPASRSRSAETFLLGIGLRQR